MSEYDPGRDPEQPGQSPEQGQHHQEHGQAGQQGQPYPTYGQYGQQYGQQQGQQSQAGQPGQQAGQYGSYGQYGQYGQQQYPGWGQYGQQYGQYGSSGSQQQRTQYMPPYGGAYPGGSYPGARRRHSGLRAVGLVLGAVIVAAVIGLGIGRFAWQPASSSSGLSQGGNSYTFPGGSSSSSTPSSSTLDLQSITAKVDPALVDVTSTLGYQNEEAAGTGIVLTANGEVLTNNHVVEGATSIEATDIGNGKTYKATVVGYDRSQDVAVLQLTGASGLTTADIGDSSTVSVGDAVVGIGNAGGTGGTPSAATGTVTALDQSITASDDSSGSSEQLTGLIQVAADIKSGDSGGSLVNSSGEVIGMDTAASAGYQFEGRSRSGSSGNSNTQGFAIPINQAVSIAKEIESGKGTSDVHIGQTAFLGVSVVSASSQSAQGGNSGNSSGVSGAVIQQVVTNSPAAKAGLVAGDTIVSVNGAPITSADTLTTTMDQHHPGDQLTVVWLDQQGQQHSGTITPVSGPVG
ncbi:MAG TPA: S1C family serine protease [Pseudonocardiaceae bacterium]